MREGPRGPFLGCSGYPKCRNIVDCDAQGNPVKPVETGINCEKCGKPASRLSLPRAVLRSVLLVLEQSVLHVKNSARLLSILTKELALPPERIKVIVNRYGKHSAVTLEDVQRALGLANVVTVPNYFELSLDSIDTGMPLFDLDKDTVLVRSLRDLQAHINGVTRPARTGLLGRLPLFARR